MSGLCLGALLAFLVVERTVRQIAWRLRVRSRHACRQYVDEWLTHGQPEALDQLVKACRRRRRVAADLLLTPMRALRGEVVQRGRMALAELGCIDDWHRQTADRRWWIRAEAVHALGLAEDPAAIPTLVRLLEDVHREVRAAAIEALGRIGDPATLPHLIAQLDNPLQQRVRVVAALSSFGSEAAEAVAGWGRSHPENRASAAEVLGQLGSLTALPVLTVWIEDGDPVVRAVCLKAVGDIGVDERMYYFALRALADSHAEVRAMAARALGRSGRADSSSYLAPRLADEWTVAAHSAAALRRLGEAGARCLSAAADGSGPGAELARRVLWGAQG